MSETFRAACVQVNASDDMSANIAAANLRAQGVQVMSLHQQESPKTSFADIIKALNYTSGPCAQDILGFTTQLAVMIRAGISIRHAFLDITPNEWNDVMAVNLTGVFNVAQTAARHMMERGGGVILNTASTSGTHGYPYYADYNATKGGVIALTKAMALELAPTVRVNAISPGYCLTPMQRAEYTDEMLQKVNNKIPLGRHAKPEEIAALFAFLASEDAAFASGHVYVMDGAETTGGLASQR